MSNDNEKSNESCVQGLIERGVIVPAPSSVQIDPTIDSSRIAPGVVIHAGCKLSGETTSIGPGCVLGEEAPSTVVDCQLGSDVRLKGGFFAGSVFLAKASTGSGAHVRPGCLLEEEASVAHTAGLKQTIFLSYVTAGSLINACDMLMAGGTSRRNHSEIGSSFVHFNFTPHGDKATASLVGDVPRGVLLDQPPIFLGGQGGLVGPVRIEYGCLVPAGLVRRKDALSPSQMLFASPSRVEKARPYDMGVYGQVTRIVENNLIYIGSIHALRAWYECARARTMAKDEYETACRQGALAVLESVLAERLKRLSQFAEKVALSVELLKRKLGPGESSAALRQQEAFLKMYPELETALQAGVDPSVGAEYRDVFLSYWNEIPEDTAHPLALDLLPDEGKRSARLWLQSIVSAAIPD